MNSKSAKALAAIAMFAADLALYLRRHNPGLYNMVEHIFADIADIAHRAFFIKKRVTRREVEAVAIKIKLLLEVVEKSGIKDEEYFITHFAPMIARVDDLVNQALGERE